MQSTGMINTRNAGFPLLPRSIPSQVLTTINFPAKEDRHRHFQVIIRFFFLNHNNCGGSVYGCTIILFYFSTRFVGKPDRVSNLFLTYFDYFFGGGVNTNLGVERHQKGVKPPTPGKPSTVLFVKP